MSRDRAPLAMIAAVGPGRVIGKDGGLPWRLPEDLRHFKAATMGHAIVMGRRTWDSIGRPLPGRTSVVVSRGRPTLPDGIVLAHDLDEALRRARAVDAEPLIIGGGGVYAEAMPLATRLLVTEVEVEVEGGDAFFPPIPPDFREVSRRPGETPGVTFVEYVR